MAGSFAAAPASFSSSEVSQGVSLCISSSTRAVEYMHMEWTDEKHNLYLNSMEASFINQLYNSEYGSTDLLGRLLRNSRKNPKPPGSKLNRATDQFKVLRRGCWLKLNFERPRGRAGIKNETRLATANIWIQHFRSPGIVKGLRQTSDQVETNVLSRQADHVEIQRHGGEVTSSKQLQDLCAEVSDQNFVDADLEGVEQSKRGSS